LPFDATQPASSQATDSAVGILLVNLGTPDAPTPAGLRPFLREFLSDRRVIDLPRWKWWPILHLFILPFRARRSAKLYRKIWTKDGSPLLTHTRRLSEGLAEALVQKLATPIHVAAGMRYGHPSIAEALRELRERACTRFLVLPLFPQYSHTTVGSVIDAVNAELETWTVMPELRTVHRYYNDPAYIQAIGDSIREAWSSGDAPERIIFSFHGIPQRYVTAGDPYADECLTTAKLVAENLKLPEHGYEVSFQSIFGRDEWIKPATVSTVRTMARSGVEKIDVICPGFSVDCLETLEEIDHTNRDIFVRNGGHDFHYIPCLNDRRAHVKMLTAVLLRTIDDWVKVKPLNTAADSPSLELLQRLDRPGPRYTSYPTAVEFHDGVDQRIYQTKLGEADRMAPDAPLSIYVHLPFCRHLCHFCACNAMATPHERVLARYLDYLEREISAVAGQLPHRRTVAQLHWGGGTPTYFSPAQLQTLFEHITSYFTLQPGAEIAIEADPRVTSREHLETLDGLGFNRLSLGVQDFTPEVQEAIGRGQTYEQTAEIVRYARAIGFSEGINFDLIYGLPRQGLESLDINLERVLELKPDRLAIYSFAYLPAIKANQRRLKSNELPEPPLKLQLYRSTLAWLLGAGYEPIGMDHFSLPDDELAVAAREGRLARNFMGYTVKPSTTTIAFGVSAIGDLAGGYFQNSRKLSNYYQALDQDRLPIERGRLLSDDDWVRRDVIMQLMCNFRIDKKRVSSQFGIDFDDYFADSIARLGELEDEGFLHNDDEAITVSGQGRLFVRNAAMAFDSYLGCEPTARLAFSRTV
jgi:oxygen-independent coproporphyrinogen-3 oxidase